MHIYNLDMSRCSKYVQYTVIKENYNLMEVHKMDIMFI
jgi:hypothetical protein